MDDPHLEKMFRITGFDSMFSIHRSVEDAIRAEAEPAS
jgi:hypothetical protein